MTDRLRGLLRTMAALDQGQAKLLSVAGNEAILEANRAEIDRIAVERGLQAAIDYANSLIDTRLGIVGGDGTYYDRAGFPQD